MFFLAEIIKNLKKKNCSKSKVLRKIVNLEHFWIKPIIN